MTRFEAHLEKGDPIHWVQWKLHSDTTESLSDFLTSTTCTLMQYITPSKQLKSLFSPSNHHPKIYRNEYLPQEGASNTNISNSATSRPDPPQAQPAPTARQWSLQALVLSPCSHLQFCFAQCLSISHYQFISMTANTISTPYLNHADQCGGGNATWLQEKGTSPFKFVAELLSPYAQCTCCQGQKCWDKGDSAAECFQRAPTATSTEPFHQDTWVKCWVF